MLRLRRAVKMTKKIQNNSGVIGLGLLSMIFKPALIKVCPQLYYSTDNCLRFTHKCVMFSYSRLSRSADNYWRFMHRSFIAFVPASTGEILQWLKKAPNHWQKIYPWETHDIGVAIIFRGRRGIQWVREYYCWYQYWGVSLLAKLNFVDGKDSC